MSIFEIIRKLTGDKKAWRKMEARAKALPKEYEFVYHKIQNHMFKFASGHEAGMDMIPIFEDLLDLFEDGAANGKRVLEVTGEDVAAFCDGLLLGARTYTEDWRQSLNKDIKKKLDPKEKGGDK